MAGSAAPPWSVLRRPRSQRWAARGLAVVQASSGTHAQHISLIPHNPSAQPCAAANPRCSVGKRIHLSLLANPSHLEAVNTVAMGKVGACPLIFWGGAVQRPPSHAAVL